MIRCSKWCPREDIGHRSQSWGEARLVCFLELLVKERREHNNRFDNAQSPERRSFFDRRDPISPGRQGIECSDHRTHAYTIGIGFDHWDERNTSTLLESFRVPPKGAEVDIDPSAKLCARDWTVYFGVYHSHQR